MSARIREKGISSHISSPFPISWLINVCPQKKIEAKMRKARKCAGGYLRRSLIRWKKGDTDDKGDNDDAGHYLRCAADPETACYSMAWWFIAPNCPHQPHLPPPAEVLMIFC